MSGALKPGRARPARWLAFSLLALAAAWLVLAISIVTYAGKDAGGNADAAIVLGAAVSDTVPSPVFEARLRHARDLYLQRRVRLIVVTGGRGPGDALSEGDAGRQWLIRQGVPADSVLAETRSRTTIQNLAFARPLLDARRAETVLIVSDPLHMRRAMVVAARQGLNADPSPTPSSRYRSAKTQAPFLLRETWFLAQYIVIGQ